MIQLSMNHIHSASYYQQEKGRKKEKEKEKKRDGKKEIQAPGIGQKG